MKFIISMLDAEIDSLKWEYKNSYREGNKRLYSAQILECIKAKKYLQQVETENKALKETLQDIKSRSHYRAESSDIWYVADEALKSAETN